MCAMFEVHPPFVSREWYHRRSGLALGCCRVECTTLQDMCGPVHIVTDEAKPLARRRTRQGMGLKRAKAWGDEKAESDLALEIDGSERSGPCTFENTAGLASGKPNVTVVFALD